MTNINVLLSYFIFQSSFSFQDKKTFFIIIIINYNLCNSSYMKRSAKFFEINSWSVGESYFLNLGRACLLVFNIKVIFLANIKTFHTKSEMNQPQVAGNVHLKNTG